RRPTATSAARPGHRTPAADPGFLPALLLRSGRRWRAAPDEGASGASLLLGFGKDQRHASLRSRPLIRPPGTFSRKREKGFLPNSRREGSGPSPSPAQREKVARSAG